MTNIKCPLPCAMRDHDEECAAASVEFRASKYGLKCNQFINLKSTDHLEMDERVFPVTRGDRKFLKEQEQDD